MKKSILLLFTAVTFLAPATRAAVPYAPSRNVDSLVAALKLNNIRDPGELADTLASYFSSDSEKVRAIYFWITAHIAYDYRQYRRLAYGGPVKLPHGMDYETWKEERLYKTLAGKKGVCQDYADLFATMCRAVKIPCQVIIGYGASQRVCILMLLDQKDSNHAWNAVYINGSWHLLDLTWASGTVGRKGRFIRQRNDFYYFTDPAGFIKEHRPLNSRWQLLPAYVSMKAFRTMANKEVREHSGWYAYWTPF